MVCTECTNNNKIDYATSFIVIKKGRTSLQYYADAIYDPRVVETLRSVFFYT